MCKSQTLRALVQERLSAAAEEIFALFERTIAEFEEELCRSKEENQRKQELLLQLTAGVQMPSLSPGPGLNLEIPETPQMKEEPEEPSVKQEHEQLPVAVCVTKTEECFQFQQRQSEHREETWSEDISAEPHLHQETEGDTERSSDACYNEYWTGPFSLSAALMGTGADRDDYDQVQIRDGSTAAQNAGPSPKYKSRAKTSVNNGDMSEGAERKKHHCPFCSRSFGRKQHLQNHVRIHTGEKPYSCSICKKTFAQSANLEVHKRRHTGERPYSCSACKKGFMSKGILDIHVRTHTGEKPFSCSLCDKTFTKKSNLRAHMRLHTGESPHS